MQVYIRKVIESDTNLILSNFLNHFRQSSFAKEMNNSTYFDFMDALIKDKIKAGHCYVACSVEDPWIVFGWIIANDIGSHVQVDYIYIKENFRNLHLSSRLIDFMNPDKKPMYNTALAENVRNKGICKKYKSVYNPLLFLRF